MRMEMRKLMMMSAAYFHAVCFRKRSSFFALTAVAGLFSANTVDAQFTIGTPVRYSTGATATIPTNGYYYIEVFGGDGGSGASRLTSNIGAGGAGAAIRGFYNLNAGDSLTMQVGGAGGNAGAGITAAGAGGAAIGTDRGLGNGGAGGQGIPRGSGDNYYDGSSGGGGGAASGIFRNGTAAANIIMVAGGGGGGSGAGNGQSTASGQNGGAGGAVNANGSNGSSARNILSNYRSGYGGNGNGTGGAAYSDNPAGQGGNASGRNGGAGGNAFSTSADADSGGSGGGGGGGGNVRGGGGGAGGRMGESLNRAGAGGSGAGGASYSTGSASSLPPSPVSESIKNTGKNGQVIITYVGPIYTITLDRTGGTGGSASTIAFYNGNMSSITIPSKTNYTFKGYWDSPTGGTQYYTKTGQSLRKWTSQSNGTLYAQWETAYTITFNGNGGTPATQTRQLSVDDDYIPTNTNLTLMGYAFTGGWSLTPNGPAVTTISSANASNHTVYAIWDGPLSYSITFSGNGGTPSSQTKSVTFGTPYGTPAETVTREGYTFLRWSTSVSGPVAGNFTNTSARTIYAVWQANTYTVFFNANGGSVSPANKSVTFNSLYGALPEPVYAGYVFAGWKSASGFIGSNSTVAIASNHTLTAQWMPVTAPERNLTIETVPVNNAGNAAYSGYGAVNYNYHIGKFEITNEEYTKFLNAAASESDPYGLYNPDMAADTANGGITAVTNAGVISYTVKSGREYWPVSYVSIVDAMRFCNWVTTGSISNGVYSITDGGSGIEIVRNEAAWLAGGVALATEDEWYKAAYHNKTTGSSYYYYPNANSSIYTTDANYNSTGIGQVTNVDYGAESSYGTMGQAGNVWELTDTIYSTGFYVRRGGAFNSASSYLSYSSSYNRSTHSVTGDQLDTGFRVACLTKILDGIEVAFDAGAGGTVTPETKVVKTTELYGELPVPVRTGYVFDRWMFNGGVITSNTTVTATTNHTLVAQWITLYTLTFSNEGSTGGSAPDPISGTNGTVIVIPGSNTLSKTGYTFNDWNDAAAGTGNSYAAGESYTISSSVTFYATWTVKSNIVVTFDTDGGTMAPVTLTVTFNSEYGELPVPVKSGYIFDNWMLGGNIITSNTIVSTGDDHELVAQWAPEPVIVTLDPNGGTVSPDTVNVYFGEAYGALPVPVLTGYLFVCWELDNGTPVTPASIVNTTNSHTLKAKWIESNFWPDYRDPSWTYSTNVGAINIITNGAELAQFVWLINEGNTFVGTVTRITADIELGAHIWVTLGGDLMDVIYGASTGFRGTLTADSGVLIKDMTIINATVTTNGSDRVGYAGFISLIGVDGRLESLTFTDTAITVAAATTNITFAIGSVASVNLGIIDNCVNYGMVFTDITGSGSMGIVGGLVGYNALSGAVMNGVSYGAVDFAGSSGMVGGIVGGNLLVASLANCVNYSTVNGAGGSSGSIQIGGIAGINADSSMILNVVNHGEVTGSGAIVLGAIAGMSSGSTNEYCYWNTNTVSTALNAIGGGDIPGVCATFGDAPGSFADEITVNGVATDDLLTALSSWVETAPMGDVAYLDWTLDDSPDGYPWFGTGVVQPYWPNYRDLDWDYSTDADSVNIITTGAELAQFAWLIGKGVSFIDTVNIITANIDLSPYRWVTPGFDMDDMENSGFCGTLTAEPGVKINGMEIIKTTSIQGYIGLGGFLGLVGVDGRLESLTFTNTVISVKDRSVMAMVASVAAINMGVIDNCVDYGTISVTNSNSSSDSSSDGGSIAGGIAAYNIMGTIVNSVSHGMIDNVSTSMAVIGGIAGLNVEYSWIANCVNYAALSGVSTESEAIVGGIVGMNECTVMNVVNHGTVNGSGDFGFVSGAIAGINNEEGTIQYVYWNTNTVGTVLDVIGQDNGTTDDYTTFGAAPGMFDEPFTVDFPGGGSATVDSLLDALNAWVELMPPDGITYLEWTLEGSPDGYPWFGKLYEEYDFTWDDDGTNVVITSYIGTNSVVTVPNEIAGFTVIGIADGAFSITNGNAALMECVTLESNITVISDNAFSGLSGLTNVVFEGDVTSIGAGAFYGTGLTKITLDGVTYIGENAFSGSKLTTITLDGDETIGFGAFNNLTYIPYIIIRSDAPVLEGNLIEETKTVYYLPKDSYTKWEAFAGVHTNTVPLYSGIAADSLEYQIDGFTFDVLSSGGTDVPVKVLIEMTDTLTPANWVELTNIVISVSDSEFTDTTITTTNSSRFYRTTVTGIVE